MEPKRSTSCRMLVETNSDVVILGYPSTGDIKIQFKDGFVWPNVFRRAVDNASDGKRFTGGPVEIVTRVHVPFLYMDVTISVPGRPKVQITLEPDTIDEITERIGHMQRLLRCSYGFMEEVDENDEGYHREACVNVTCA